MRGLDAWKQRREMSPIVRDRRRFAAHWVTGSWLEVSAPRMVCRAWDYPLRERLALPHLLDSPDQIGRRDVERIAEQEERIEGR